MGKSKVKRGKGGKVVKKPTKKQLEAEAAKAEAAQTEQKVATSGAESELEAGIVCTFGESARGVAANMRDIKVDQLSISFHGHKLVQDCQLNLNFGRRYGLLGANGSGKSTLMKAIAYRMVPIPENIDIFFLDGEYAATDKTALQAVLDVDAERAKLEKEADELSQQMGEGGMKNSLLRSWRISTIVWTPWMCQLPRPEQLLCCTVLVLRLKCSRRRRENLVVDGGCVFR